MEISRGVVGNFSNPIPREFIEWDISNFENSGSKDMTVNGNATNQLFDFTPTGTDVWYMVGISFQFSDPGQMSHNVFGSTGSSLSNGLQFEYQTNGGSTIVMFNMVDNKDIATTFMPKSSGGHFQNAGSNQGLFNTQDYILGSIHFPHPLILRGVTGDFARWRVQDNLNPIQGMESRYMAWKRL